eukprot:5473650-Prymnesium_polylepis.1
MRRSSTLGVASGGSSGLPGSRRKSSRSASAMNVWQLQAALFGADLTGDGEVGGDGEAQSHGTAETQSAMGLSLYAQSLASRPPSS